MLDNDPVTLWLQELRNRDDEAANRLWNHFVGRLHSLARRKLPSKSRRVYDEEDAVISAFRSVCLGISDGRFPNLNDRGGLWGLMLTITARKVARRNEYDNRQRRDVSRNLDELMFSNSDAPSGQGGLDQFESREPTPEFAAEFVETCELLFEDLNNQNLQSIVTLRMDGYSDTEISDRLNCSRRTVQRKLEIIRRRWSKLELSDE